jgi:hypothetical protein
MKYSAIWLSLAFAASTSACGGAFEEEGTDPESVSTATAGLTYTEPVYWTQGTPSKGIGNVNNSVCFLTFVQGRFAGDGEEVGIFGVSPGAWHLGGTSQQTNVKAAARCITGITTSDYTQAQYWYQGDARVPLGRFVNGSFVQVDNSWSCFLVSMRGRFDGFGEEIRTTFDDGGWYLTGKSQQAGVKAGAQCVRRAKQTTYTHTWPDPGVVLHPELPDATRFACFLRRVSGYFDPNTIASVELGPTGPYWRLVAKRQGSGEVRASASCVF